MDFTLRPVGAEEIGRFKKAMQEAFQHGFEAYFGKTADFVLPDRDIEESLHAKGAAAYGAFREGRLLGGAVVVIHEETGYSHLDLLFVKDGAQNHGLGAAIWRALEKRYPHTKVWETCTPYFDRRNIHFYVNVCGFQITEFFNEKHPMPDTPDGFIGDGHEGMFIFKKQMG